MIKLEAHEDGIMYINVLFLLTFDKAESICQHFNETKNIKYFLKRI